MNDTATLSPAAVQTLDEGPLIPTYDAAKTNGSLAIGSFDQFVEAAGVPLVGSSDLVVALVDEDKSTSLKVAGKLAPIHGAATSPLPQFEGGEHTAIGDSILLYFGPNQPSVPAYQVQLAVQPGLNLTYGQILALGGDFYGVPDAPISDGATQAARMALFQNAYQTLAGNPASVAEAANILAIMQREISAVNAALNAGLSPSTVYDQLGDDLNKAWNVATGGGSFVSDLIPMGRYLELATKNWDHFGPYAVLAYQAGHAVALNQAIAAYNAPTPPQAQQMLITAYAMNAFADHFLSDLFSAGHIRDPRKEIYTTSWVGVSANLCAKGMHDEDSKFGLMVSNANGDTWRAYGDKRYFETYNLTNKAIVDNAVQASALEIYQAFQTGQQPVNPNQYIALQFIPNLAQVMDYQNDPLGNFTPMFILVNGAVQCRSSLNDLNTRGWTSVWTTGGVAATLHSPVYHPGNPAAFVAAPTAAPVIGAAGWNRNQPVPPNWVNGNQVRYYASFLSPNFESEVGPPCAYYALNNQFEPMVSNVPIGPAGVTARAIYREFINTPITWVGTIYDNVTTVFDDTNP